MTGLLEEDLHTAWDDEVSRGALTTAGAWSASVFNGWFTAGHRSEWARRVTDSRIATQDQVRPHFTRGALLVALGGCLLVLDAPRWALAWLALGGVQVVLEVMSDSVVRAKHEDLAIATRFGRSKIGRLLVRMWYWNYETSITNITGLIGAVAAPGNVLVVMYATASDAEPHWVRIMALVIAMMFLASGALGPLLDTGMYSPVSSLPRWLTACLRWAWLGVVGVIVLVLIINQPTTYGWGPGLPYAVMAVIGIGYYPMLRCREYERAVAAAALTADELRQTQYEAIATDLHNLLQPVKHSLLAAAQLVPNRTERAEVESFIRDIRYTYEKAQNRTLDLSVGLGMPLQDHLKTLASAEMVRLNLDLRPPEHLQPEQAQRMKQWLIVLVHNSAQAYRSWSEGSTPTATARAYADGTDLVLEVSDLLGLIPQEVWNDLDTTLCKVRGDVSALGGTMAQDRADDGHKTITIRWRAISPLRNRTDQEEGR